jgi:type IV pilus assembly protein PilA
MRKGFTLIEVLVVAVIVAILAAVAIPAYNAYIKGSKEKVALNFAATVAQSAATYYAQSQKAPADIETDLNVTAPSGYSAAIGTASITVEGDGTTAGYLSTDLDPQAVQWRR